MKIQPILSTYYSRNKNIFKKNINPIKQNNRDLLNCPLYFQGITCSEGNFRLKKIKNLHCPICEKIMLSDEQREEFVRDVSLKRGQDLIDALDKYQDESVFIDKDDKYYKSQPVYREQKQEVVNIIKSLAKKHPDLSLSQLVDLKIDESLNKLIPLQLEVLDELDEYFKTLDVTPKDKTFLKKLISEYSRRVIGTSPTRFKIQALIYDSINWTEDKNIQDNVMEILSKLPNSKNSVESFFVNYYDRKYDSKDIARAIIYTTRPTAEHMITKSSGGPNNTSNYICDCDTCNGKRGSMPFYDWQKTIPNVKEKFQKYLNTIQEYLNDNYAMGYENYCSEIADLIKDLSNGEIVLEVPPQNLAYTIETIEEKKLRYSKRNQTST